jgi:hypothetical protein
MFSLAIEAGKLHHKPHFAMLRDDNVRVGFSSVSSTGPCSLTCLRACGQS